jgi:hypothetical protein
LSKKVKFWIAGLVVAAAGIIVAKLISPLYISQPDLQAGLFAAGVLIALVGLGLVMAAVRIKA